MSFPQNCTSSHAVSQAEGAQFSHRAIVRRKRLKQMAKRASESALAGEQFRNHARLLDEFFERDALAAAFSIASTNDAHNLAGF
jgi:myo-inositol catabolism protein IolC